MTYLAYDKLIHFPPAPVTEPLELKASPGHQLFPFAKLGPANHLTILQVGAAQVSPVIMPGRYPKTSDITDRHKYPDMSVLKIPGPKIETKILYLWVS